MAKNNRGGRTKHITTQSGTSLNKSLNQTQQNVQNGQQMMQQISSDYDADFIDAIKLYVSDTDEYNGYSISQDLNYSLDNNLPLKVNAKFVDRYLSRGMKPTTNDMIVYRASHDDWLKDMGIKDYTKLSEKQLQQLLKGQTYTTKSYTSGSYDRNKNPFLVGSKAGGREIEWRTKLATGTKVVSGNDSQAEVITDKGTRYRITDVHYVNDYATRRGYSGSRQKIVIDVETY